MTTPSLATPRSLTGSRLSLGRRGRLTGMAVAGALAVTGAGYAIGIHRHDTTHIATGYAYASSQQIGATSDGWSYAIPLDVRWMDSEGTWHDGDRPACLPATQERMPVRFAWVPVQVGQMSWRAVVWVDCR